MANPFRKKSGWQQYGLVCFMSVIMMVLDSKTNYLNAPRNFMAIVVSPVQALASLPVSVGRYFNNAISAEPNLEIAYENLRNEYFQLKSETLLLRTLKEENDSLRSLLDATQRLK